MGRRARREFSCTPQPTAPSSSRRSRKMRVSRRETCICVTPMSSAISRWVSPSKKRSSMMCRSRRAQPAYDGRERHPCLRRCLLVVVVADQLAERGPALVADGAVQRGRAEAALSIERLTDVGRSLLEVLGELVGSRWTAQRGVQVGARTGEALLQLLDPAWWAHHPALVAEVATHLAPDRRDAEGQEVVPGVRIEAARGLGQREVGHLLEVLGRDTAGPVTRHHGVSHRHVDGSELVGQLVPLGLARALREQSDEPPRPLGASEPPVPGCGDRGERR